MKRWLLAFLVLIAVLAGLMLAAGLAAKALVTGDTLKTTLAEKMGVAVSVGSTGFDLGQWFRLKPAIALEDVTIGNPPGFHTKQLLGAKKLTAQVSLVSLLSKKLEVYSIGIEQPQVSVESNAQGATNLETFLKRLPGRTAPEAKPAAAGTGGPGLSIHEVQIHSGELTVSAAKAPDAAEPLNISGIDLRLLDFQADRTCRLEMNAKLFRGERSRLRIEGQAGPFTADSLPINGAASVTLWLAEIPVSWRKRELGNILGSPGDKARATLQVSLQGDVYRTLSGPAKLDLSDVRIGKDDKHVLPLSGEASLTFSAANLMSDPAFHLKLPNGRLRLGHGEWSGEAELRSHGSAISGATKGKISNVEINELVSGLSAANDKIYGVLEVPSYAMQFSGKNADDLLRSASGGGKLSITKGRIAALDLLASIQRALESKQEASEKGATPFTTLAADLGIGQGNLNLSGIVLEGPNLHVTGQGVLHHDQTLQFDLQARVGGTLARLVNQISLRQGQDGALVPLAVTGTVEAPRVRPSVGKMATGVARGILDSIFKKK